MSDIVPIHYLTQNRLHLRWKAGWLPNYDLTDGQLVYGKLNYENMGRRTALLETDTERWKVCTNKKLNVADLSGNSFSVVIGEIFKLSNSEAKVGERIGKILRKPNLPGFYLNIDHTPELIFNGVSGWKVDYNWSDVNNICLVEMAIRSFSLKELKFDITPAGSDTSTPLLLMLLTGAHIHFLLKSMFGH